MPIISISDQPRLTWLLSQVPTWVVRVSSIYTFDHQFPVEVRDALRARFGERVGLAVARQVDLNAVLPCGGPFTPDEFVVITRGVVLCHVADEQPNQTEALTELMAVFARAPVPESVRRRSTRRLAALAAALERIADSARDRESDGAEPAHVVLGVPPNATSAQVEAAFRSLAKGYHPDRTAALGAKLKDLADREMKRINFARHQMLG